MGTLILQYRPEAEIIDLKFIKQDKISKVKHHCIVTLLALEYSICIYTVSFIINVMAKHTPTLPLSLAHVCLHVT